MAESKETRRPLNGATVAKYRTKLFANAIWKKLGKVRFNHILES